MKLYSIWWIISESMKTIFRNRKLFTILSLAYLLLSTIFLIVFSFTSKSILRDMLVKESFFPISTFPGSDYSNHFAGFKDRLGYLLSIDFSFLVSYFCLSFFSTIATISITSQGFLDKILLVKELIIRVSKSWTRPLITMFYTMLLVIGFFFFMLNFTGPFLANLDIFSPAFVVAFLVAVVAYMIYVYISVVWILGIVVSVVEDCYGLEALGKAGGLLKGNGLLGLVYNIFLNVLTLFFVFFVQESTILTGQTLVLNKVVILLVTVSISCLLRMFQFVGFTVFYFHCKKHHGEEIGMQGNLEVGEYAKLPITSLVNDLPRT